MQGWRNYLKNKSVCTKLIYANVAASLLSALVLKNMALPADSFRLPHLWQVTCAWLQQCLQRQLTFPSASSTSIETLKLASAPFFCHAIAFERFLWQADDLSCLLPSGCCWDRLLIVNRCKMWYKVCFVEITALLIYQDVTFRLCWSLSPLMKNYKNYFYIP